MEGSCDGSERQRIRQQRIQVARRATFGDPADEFKHVPEEASKMAVPRCELAPGFSVSRVIHGLWQVADMEREGAELDPCAASRAMQPYVEAGFTTFDMADHYGSAEIIAGTFTAQHAGRAQMLTKWVPPAGPVSREQVREAVQTACTRLQTECLDLLQFHSWNYADLSYLDALFFLDELRQEGMIRHLGLTNFDTDHLRVVVQSGIPIVSNQVCHSLLDQRAAGEMAEFCQSHGVRILAYGTLAGGLLTDRSLNAAEPREDDSKTWSLAKYQRFVTAAGGWERFQSVLRDLKGLADRRDVSLAALASRFILERPAVGAIILGVRLGESEHLAETQRMLEFSFDESLADEVRQIIAPLDPIPGDCGDEYRRKPFLTASGDLSHHLDSMPAVYSPVTHCDRTKVFSGTSWEPMAGYCRAVREGNRILVSGTTATHGSRTIGGDDAGAQATFVLDKIEGSIQSLGGRREDIVRTRVFVRDINDWEPVARAHGHRLGDVCPANTLVQANLIGDYRVEIEAEAVIKSPC